MFESFVVYLSLFVVMLLCSIYAAKREPIYQSYSGDYVKNNNFLQPEIILLIAVFTFVFGCRWNVGVDYPHYYHSYINGYQFVDRIEPLFKNVAQLLYNNGFHYAWFFSVWAFVDIFLIYYALRDYRFILPFFTFFFIFGFYWMSMMNVIRQQIAACIFLVSIYFIENKKAIPYYLCVLLAYLFHKSALLLIVIYPILRFRDDWFKNIPLQLLFYLLCVFLSNRMSDIVVWIERPFRWFTDTFEYEQYGYNVLNIDSLNDKTRFGRNTGLGVYAGIIKTLPIILMSKKLKKYYNSKFFNIVYTLWFIVVTIGMVLNDSIVLYRPFVYFVNITPIIQAFFCYYCFRSKQLLFQIVSALIMLLQMVLFVNYVSYGEFNTAKFLFFWQK